MSEQIESEALVRLHLIESLDYYVNMWNERRDSHGGSILNAEKMPEGIKIVNRDGKCFATIVISGVGCLVEFDDRYIKTNKMAYGTFYNGVQYTIRHFFEGG